MIRRFAVAPAATAPAGGGLSLRENRMTGDELVRFFENEIIRREQDGSGTGDRPYAPVLVAYLGDADRQHDELERAVFQLWPQFRRELRFLALGEDDRFYSLPAEGRGEKAELSAAELEAVVTSGFGTDTHFENHDYLNVCYVMQTDGFSDVADYDRWVYRLRRFQRRLCDIAVRTVLVVLLNEDYVGCHRAVAGSIRRRLGVYCGGEGSPLPVDSVYLLSNRRSDNVILGSWDVCSHIIAAILAVSNSRDLRVGQNEGRQVYTVGYAREEKPLREIARVVVRRVVGTLSDMMRMDDLRPDPDLLERLGITERATLRLLDAEADKLPLPALDIFPRRDAAKRDLPALSGDAFDKLTMGSWRSYLERLADALDAPRRSIVLTDTGTALKRELSKTLPDINDSPSAALDGKYYYYNTGGGAAETLRIIAVSSAQLL